MSAADTFIHHNIYKLYDIVYSQDQDRPTHPCSLSRVLTIYIILNCPVLKHKASQQTYAFWSFGILKGGLSVNQLLFSSK